MAAVGLLKTTVSKTNSSGSNHSSNAGSHQSAGHGHQQQQSHHLMRTGNNKMQPSTALSIQQQQQQQQHNQLTRSLERILEDAHLSGELKLSGRKLRDFPKAAGKYNLNDTVIADLSRNRFCELPDDLTAFPFLETLFMCHNTLRSLPDSVRGLHSLTYLDLRSNQLSVLPREICFLPLQVLLISNNRLVSLPEELGRMSALTELDAASNQMSHLPARMSDLHSLRSLSLRSNQLVYLPREVTYLSLVALDISNNRIASLPVELRIMTTLVELELENNPLTSPPASVCVRGLVHVFKYLETVAAKEERIKSGGSLDGHGTLRRGSLAKQQQQQSNATAADPAHSHKYNTLGGMRRPAPPVATVDPNSHHQQLQQQQQSPIVAVDPQKWSPSHQSTLQQQQQQPPYGSELLLGDSASRSSTPAMSPMMTQRHVTDSPVMDGADGHAIRKLIQPPAHPAFGGLHGSDESSPSPDGGDGTPDSQRSDEKLKMQFNNMQSYREYKEALRQQRQQDSTAVYRQKEEGGGGGNHVHFAQPECSAPPYKPPAAPAAASHPHSNNGGSPEAIALPKHAHSQYANGGSSLQSNYNSTASPKHHHPQNHQPANGGGSDEANNVLLIKPPPPSTTTKSALAPTKSALSSSKTYQPSEWSTAGTAATNNGNPAAQRSAEKVASYNHYVKPSSPCKVQNGNGTTAAGLQKMSLSAASSGVAMTATSKATRTVSWNRDIPNEKLSFTMRREFDKQKEETELIEQLRQIIESRLKMQLPEDVASALTDGVVLCHLANQVRPRSVGSIHVPSPAVPKLTMARCRRNVDNFLNACRNIGVDEEWLCSCAAILPAASPPPAAPIATGNNEADGLAAQEQLPQSQDSDRLRPEALVAVHRAVLGLHTWALATDGGQPRTASVSAAAVANNNNHQHNTKTTDEYRHREQQSQPNIVHAYTAHRYEHNQGRGGQGESNSVEVGADNGKPSNRPSSLDFASDHTLDNKSSAIRRRIAVAESAETALNNNNHIDTASSSKSTAGASTKKRRTSSAPKRYFGPNGQLLLVGIVEECEYDSDAGKFTCAADDSSTASTSSSVATATIVDNVNGEDEGVCAMDESSSATETSTMSSDQESASVGSTTTVVVNEMVVASHPLASAEERRRSSLLCLAAFLLTAILLYLFPLPA